MFSSKSSAPLSNSVQSLKTSAASIAANDFDRASYLKTLGVRSAQSRLEIGTFNRVFSTSGSVRQSATEVFRFDLSNRQRLRIYLGNQFPSSSSSRRRMVVDLLNDSNLRRVSTMSVIPARIDAITTTLNPGTYRIRISTQSNDRGRYFMDMIRV
ncbi:MAG TPA: hypothetical protein V6C65_30210 [Allocoleopsis sp.]